MNRKLLAFPVLLAGLSMLSPQTQAKQGAPHTLSGSANYSTVNLTWAAPETEKKLQWHTDQDYDGESGRQVSSQNPCVIYVASDFRAADLSLLEGEKIEGLSYFEYRPTLAVTALIYEDGKIVREAPFDLKTPEFKANQWRKAKFAEPYTVTKGKDIRIALRIEHGTNVDFVAIMDRAADPRGDLHSYDGKTWYHHGRGTYLLPANLANDVDEAPTGYNVYADGKKLNDSLLSSLSYSAADQQNGRHTYSVEAVYDGGAFKTPEVALDVRSADSYYPSPAVASATTESMNGSLSWKAPLMRGNDNVLTWSDSKLQSSIGGTASSNTKVWIKNEFDQADLLSFAGAKITAINGHFREKTVSSVITYVMKDGAIIGYDTVPAEKIAEIEAEKWVKFPLSNPVVIEPGHKYAYGYYVLHTPKTHPISTDSGEAVGAKGNSFSTSSSNSKDFATSKPSWKTLASGNLPGNWMLTADIEGGDAAKAPLKGYNIYRDGEKIASDITACEYSDEVPAPGTYVYGIEAVGTDGSTSSPFEIKATYKLPDSYRAPLIGESKVDREKGEISFDWGMDVELKHYGEATYKVGFDEEMTMIYGSKFTAAELADYKGYQINKLNFILGEKIEAPFKVGVFDKNGKMISGTELDPANVQALAMYTLTLTEPVSISGEEDLYFAYQATLPGGTSPIVLDAGPLNTGGAVVNLGMSWINLGTINATYNNYNIVIGAVASEGNAENAPEAVISRSFGAESIYARQLPAIMKSEIDTDIESDGIEAAEAPERAALQPVKFNVYCNGSLVATTESRSYSAKLPGYDAFTYTVSAIYPNGWESAESDPLVVNFGIRQAGPAPYDLKGTYTSLSWKAPEDAPVLSYADNGTKSFGVGMTGSGTRETYAVQKFPADSIKSLAGQRISHIRFALYETNLNSASIVIFKNLNIVYEQPVSVDDLVAISEEGYNTVRLNRPFEIDGESEIMIGYHITYQNGIKPMIYDEGPADDGLGNLLSASASATSWKTLKGMNKALDGNWRIYAILEAPDTQDKLKAPRRAGEATTYNIYRDGTMFKEGITALSYEHDGELPAGIYTVTAVNGGEESAESNAYVLLSNAVGSVAADSVSYDREAEMIHAPADMEGKIHDAAGRLMATTLGDASTAALPKGVYIFTASDGTVFKFVK